ncbi:MAG: hypothetical protein ACRD4S_15845 [Candidatus Acidiferrales bacterium]
MPENAPEEAAPSAAPSPFDATGRMPPGTFGGRTEINVGLGHFVNLVKYKPIIILVIAALLAATVGLVYWSFRLPSDSFLQELSVSLAAGIATFLGTPLIVKISAKRRGRVLPLVVILSLACGYLAFRENGDIRALLLEAAVALGLLVALEMIVHQLLESVRKKYEAAERALSNKVNTLEERVLSFDPKAGGHGMGAIDQFNDQSADQHDAQSEAENKGQLNPQPAAPAPTPAKDTAKK